MLTKLMRYAMLETTFMPYEKTNFQCLFSLIILLVESRGVHSQKYAFVSGGKVQEFGKQYWPLGQQSFASRLFKHIHRSGQGSRTS